MSAEVLRRAAALMRKRAEAAVQPVDSPRWIVDHVDRYASPREVYRGPTGAGDVAVAEDAATAEHIASWHPAVALAVADWLDRVAGRSTQYSGVLRDDALTVARAYLEVTS